MYISFFEKRVKTVYAQSVRFLLIIFRGLTAGQIAFSLGNVGALLCQIPFDRFWHTMQVQL